MKVYLDENLSPRIAELLKGRGLDAVGAHEAGNTQLTDAAQLRYAAGQGRAIVTRDVADFVVLATETIAANMSHHGILLVSGGFRANDFGGLAAAIAQVVARYPSGLQGTVLYLPPGQ